MIKNDLLKNIAPIPSVRRFPLYLTVLEEFKNSGKEWVSTTVFAEILNLKPIQVRKDLTHTGIVGKPKKGFKVNELINSLNNFLGWDRLQDAVIIGAGALGTALLGYSGFKNHGLNIVAAFDSSPSKIGNVIHGKTVQPISNLNDVTKKMQIKIGIITVPKESAQEATDTLVQAGITGIWNFSPIKVNTPDNVVVQREDLSSSLAVLSVKMEHKV